MAAPESELDRLLLAGQRPSSSAAATDTTRLHLGLLGDLQRVIDLDAKIPDGTLEPMSRRT